MRRRPRFSPARRGASGTEYVIILACISIAVLGAVTLFGRRVSRLFKAATESIDEGTPKSSSFVFPTAAPGSPGTTGASRTPNTNPDDEYMQSYQSLLGEARPVVGLLTGALPRSADLPPGIVLPTGVNQDADGAIGESFPGSRNPPFDIPDADVRERGATLYVDGNGNLVDIRPRGGASASVPVDRSPQPPGNVVGVFHTHPYGQELGGADNVPFSGPIDTNGNGVIDAGENYGDLGIFLFEGHRTAVVRTRTATWTLVRTAETVVPANSTELFNVYDAARRAAVARGASFEESIQEANLAVARRYGYAVYSGPPGEPQRRLVP
jgi:Flp pilus assembly pilin Flp